MTLDKLKLLKRLVRLSNNLDFVGEFKMAGSIDKKIIKLSAKKKDSNNPYQMSLFDDMEESSDESSEFLEEGLFDSELSTEDMSEVDKAERYLSEEYEFPIYDYEDTEDVPAADQLERMFYLTEDAFEVPDLSRKEEEEEEEEEDTFLFPDENSIDPEAFEMNRKAGDSFLIDDHSAEEFFTDSELESEPDFEIDSFDISSSERISEPDFEIDSFETGETETSFPVEDLDAPSDFERDYELFLSESNEEPELK